MNAKEIYFSPVEFAKLFNVDRQMLIYYDNQNIFSPAFKDSKGFRYYSIEQTDYFALLLYLRSHNIVGSVLGDFNQTLNMEKIIDVLQDKIGEYTENIATLSNKINAIQQTIAYISEVEALPLNQIMLIPHRTIYYQQGPSLAPGTSLKDAFVQSTALLSGCSEQLINRKLFISILPKFKVLEDLTHPFAYRLILTTTEKGLLTNPLSIPSGLQLILHVKGSYSKAIPLAIAPLQDFLARNNLETNGTALISSVKSFDYTKSNLLRTTSIALGVSYKV